MRDWERPTDRLAWAEEELKIGGLPKKAELMILLDIGYSLREVASYLRSIADSSSRRQG